MAIRSDSLSTAPAVVSPTRCRDEKMPSVVSWLSHTSLLCVTGKAGDRYMFRTSPLRNVSLQPAFFHNGAFTRLEDAVRFHLNVTPSARNYDPARAGVKHDLRGPVGPIEPVLSRIDPLMQSPVILTKDEFRQLIDFLRNSLLDDRAKPERLRKLIPTHVPSGRAIQNFQ